MARPIFLKLGGSLITEKTGYEALRHETLARLAEQVGRALAAVPGLQLVLGHGSGSFGHVAAARYATRLGVNTEREWEAFARVSDAAARLNRLVLDALLSAGVPAVSLQPSASALCDDGRLVELADDPVRRALRSGLLPVVYGDVAFDRVRGGTIISTEDVLVSLAETLNPSWLLLAGETAGVLDSEGQVIPLICSTNFDQVAATIGGSRGTDVTGGMAGKVRAMLDLVERNKDLRVRIFSGMEEDELLQVIQRPEQPTGTMITSIDRTFN